MDNYPELDYTAKEIRTLWQAGLTSLVASGRFLGKARDLLDEKEFKQWVAEQFGAGLSEIAVNLIKLNQAFDGGQASVPVPLVSPVLLLELVNNDLPVAEMRTAAESGLAIKGESKQLKDLDGKDLTWWKKKVKDTLKIANEKDMELKQKMKEKNAEIAELRQQLRTAKSEEEEDHLRSEIAKKNAEIARLRKDGNRATNKLHEKYLFSFKAGLQQPFISEAASYLREFASELKPDEKKYIKDLMNALLAEIKTFKKYMGIDK